jgi:4-alpha-glucanotransferase
MKYSRSSGILAHITSLPCAYGIGDIGKASYKFIDYLCSCNQSYWQFLPTSPTNAIFDHSPYMSTSAFAGSSLLICPEHLYEGGLIKKKSLANHPDFSPYRVNFSKVVAFKKKILDEAFSSFNPGAFPDYDDFSNSSDWLNDYAIFMTLKELFNSSGWFSWPKKFATRQEHALKAIQNDYKERINYFKFEQFIFFSQWQQLKKYASTNAITLFGDLPIYVGFDSVDVWANQHIFELDKKTLRPTHVSGVPPDYFSTTGQRWGNPLYDWHSAKKDTINSLNSWWLKRIAHLFSQVDMVRIDHFRGFESYWAIPEENETAVDGQWRKGPGLQFFTEISQKLGPLNIVAEDLGIITKEVAQLRDATGFPGMKVLQFAFDGDSDNPFLPYNYLSCNSIVYTGTHDNDTTVGWYLSDQLNDSQRSTIKRLVNRELHDHKNIHTDLMYLAQSSVSFLSIFPLQDILGFGNDCKMNSPGVPTGNWRWRCAENFLTDETAANLAASTLLFGRGRKKAVDKLGTIDTSS